MKVRKAQLEDSEALAEIQVNSYRTAYASIFPQSYLEHFTIEEQTQDWRDWLTSKPGDVLCVAENDAGEITGYALGRPGLSDIPPYDSEILALHVRPAFQRQRVGTQLLKAMIGHLKQAGCTSLMLWVLEKNPARTFYERLGGTLIGEKAWGGNDTFGVHIKEVAYGWPNMTDLVLHV